MAFRFAARTLLELGKELISSDEVALYELMKNAVDAGSRRIEVNAEVIIPHSAYALALEDLGDGMLADDVIDNLRHHILSGAPSHRVEEFFEVLEESEEDEDFEEILRSAYKDYNWIEIKDTGHGMSLAELDRVFLTVGTRSRRAANVAGATYLGDKGVGRLSTMRLGDHLTVTTTRAGDRFWNVLEVDWSLFTHETEVDVSEIAIEPERGEKKQDVSEHATRIRVSALHGDWTTSRFKELFQGDIARMVDPFEPGRANQLLTVRHNGERVLIPSIPEQLLKSAHATCKASLSFHGDEPILKGRVDYRIRSKSLEIMQRGAEVYSITQKVLKKRGKKGHAATEAVPIRPKALKALGPFEVDVYWYNRSVVEAIEGLTTGVQETRDEISHWSGGPMLYRRGFRILPYGNRDDDWLELDANAFGQSGFKLNRRQVIGRVQVHSSHTALSEQTNREGLVESEETIALRTVVMWLLHNEMRGLINEADKLERISRRQAEKSARDFRATQQKVEDMIRDLVKSVPAAYQPRVKELSDQIGLMGDQCEALASQSLSNIEQVAEDREKFIHLAGIGLMTEFIFHELDRAVSYTMSVLSDSKGSRRESALTSLEEQLKTLQKRISAFDELTGEKRQSKSTFDAAELTKTVLSAHASQFDRHGIHLTLHLPKTGFRVKAVRGMLIQILENLISNSVYWLKQQKRFEKGLRPEIIVRVDEKLRYISVEDNGPGVDLSRRDVIFQPFITSKPPGQGRGLGLYISRELAQYHGWGLVLEQAGKPRREGRLNTFVLDLGEKDD